MSPRGCLIRIGSAAEPMSERMIEQLFATRTRNSIGRITAPRQELSFAQLKIYYEAIGRPLSGKFATNLELKTAEGAYNYAAYLLADTNNTSIKVAKYSGTDRVDLGRSEKTPLEKLPETSERGKVENEVESKVESKVETPVQILRLLEENPKFTLRQVAVEIEKSISLVEKTTAKLVKEGKLRHVGPKKNGKWEVLK